MLTSEPTVTTDLPKRASTDVDIEIGARIRMARVAAGMSQEALGDKVNLTFQQIQKYEKGVNRVSVGRLVLIARALGVSRATLFPDEQSPTPEALTMRAMLSDRYGLRIATGFLRLPASQQRAIADLIESIGSAQPSATSK